MEELLQDPLLVLLAVVVAVLCLALAIGGVFWALQRKRALDKQMEEQERLFELEMTRKFDRAAEVKTRGTGALDSLQSGTTAPAPPMVASAAIGADTGVKENPSGMGSSTPGGGAQISEAGDSAVTAQQRTIARLRQLQPDMLEKGRATIRHRIEGEEMELNRGKQKALLVRSLPTAETLSFALKQYDMIILATVDGEPLIIERAQDVLLRDVGF